MKENRPLKYMFCILSTFLNLFVSIKITSFLFFYHTASRVDFKTIRLTTNINYHMRWHLLNVSSA